MGASRRDKHGEDLRLLQRGTCHTAEKVLSPFSRAQEGPYVEAMTMRLDPHFCILAIQSSSKVWHDKQNSLAHSGRAALGSVTQLDWANPFASNTAQEVSWLTPQHESDTSRTVAFTSHALHLSVVAPHSFSDLGNIIKLYLMSSRTHEICTGGKKRLMPQYGIAQTYLQRHLVPSYSQNGTEMRIRVSSITGA